MSRYKDLLAEADRLIAELKVARDELAAMRRQHVKGTALRLQLQEIERLRGCAARSTRAALEAAYGLKGA